jgi:predicted Zn-dependent peptidase
MDINKSHIMLGFLAPKFSTPQDNYALDVLATMLTSGKSSILNQKLKEEKQLVLSESAGNYSQKDSGIFYIY